MKKEFRRTSEQPSGPVCLKNFPEIRRGGGRFATTQSGAHEQLVALHETHGVAGDALYA